jgi:hypothetical protein
MKDLRARQQTLINLITRVGGKKNIQKWMDELLEIDWKLEGVKQMETLTAKAAPQAKPVVKKLNKKLETAKQQLLALGVLEESIKIENGVVQVIGADTQSTGGKTYYWDAKVFFEGNNGNVSINPNQIKNSQMRAYENYKVSQGNKPCKSFEKWLEPQLANKPKISDVVNKIDAEPASIWIKQDLHYWLLMINRSSRHVQELSAAIRHELNGSDSQDKATMVFLSKQETIFLCKRKEWDNNGSTTVRKEGSKKILCISEDAFAPILEKIKIAAEKCGDSFKMPFGLDYK